MMALPLVSVHGEEEDDVDEQDDGVDEREKDDEAPCETDRGRDGLK